MMAYWANFARTGWVRFEQNVVKAALICLFTEYEQKEADSELNLSFSAALLNLWVNL